jgi:hypothetical protein
MSPKDVLALLRIVEAKTGHAAISAAHEALSRAKLDQQKRTGRAPPRNAMRPSHDR